MKQLLLKSALSSFLLLVLFTLFFGLLYPVIVRGIGFAFFPDEASGSLIRKPSGTLVGSKLIGQNFTKEEYFHPRPSYAGTFGYDATSSDASYLGPTSQALVDIVGERATSYRIINHLPQNKQIPADAVMSSASGLDPHISLANARLQMARIAAARGVPVDKVDLILKAHTKKSLFYHTSYVNVLECNLALDTELGGSNHAAK